MFCLTSTCLKRASLISSQPTTMAWIDSFLWTSTAPNVRATANATMGSWILPYRCTCDWIVGTTTRGSTWPTTAMRGHGRIVKSKFLSLPRSRGSNTRRKRLLCREWKNSGARNNSEHSATSPSSSAPSSKCSSSSSSTSRTKSSSSTGRSSKSSSPRRSLTTDAAMPAFAVTGGFSSEYSTHSTSPSLARSSAVFLSCVVFLRRRHVAFRNDLARRGR
mmetsp:Transcript_24185/g.74584  ORF Transcript_24185/g.74584 Transcript_24185/m.74584 type:complete len:219 (-) Transcript_24185:66-722(-)